LGEDFVERHRRPRGGILKITARGCRIAGDSAVV
jgi:hypothetical protein